jgi:DNA repair protein RecN (Recombination protein N)
LPSLSYQLKVGAVSERTRLEEISIRGLGVIEEASLELTDGLTVITGETGAGKTMVLTALALVLGGKSESALVRQGKDRLVVSASFSVTDDIAKDVSEKGGAVEGDQLILSRSVTSEGKSKASAGGIAVPAGVLASLSESLIEIHGQSANMSITKASKQREILDRFGGQEIAVAHTEFAKRFEDFNAAKKKLAVLRSSASGREKEIAALREFSTAFKKLNPEIGELETLSQEISRLSSVESLQLGVGQASSLLDDEITGALTLIGQAKRSLESVQASDSAISEIVEAVNESFFLLSDASHLAIRYLSDLEMDPQRLEWAQSRKSELVKFIKAYGGDSPSVDPIPELIAKHATVEESIADLTGGEERIRALEVEVEKAWSDACQAAEELSKVRHVYADILSKKVSAEIQALAMPHTTFLCSVESADFQKGLTASELSSTGADEVSMLLQAHKDGPLVALAKGASGGEMSRVMLALEVVLASSQPVGTYIFDEVDAGVGGKAAIDVGRRLHELSRHSQVIVVTHLPQVAAWADSHFVLRKNSDGSVSQSDVREVTDEARVEEIARMLAGHEDSRSAREHAAELLSMRTEKQRVS